MNEFVFTTTTNSFVHNLEEFEDTKKSFRNYLTFRQIRIFGDFLANSVRSVAVTPVVVLGDD